MVNRVRQRIDGYSMTWSCAWVFLPLVTIYVMTATYHGVQSPDPIAASVPAWQFATHGNFNLDAFEGMLPWIVEGEHHLASDRSPGVIFFGIPFYWALSPGGTEPATFPAALAGAGAAAGAITLLHAAFRRLVSTSTAIVAALVAGLATATWTVSADGLWPHGINQLWFGAALLCLGAGAWTGSSPFFGLAIFTRPHTAFVAAVAGLYGSLASRSLRPLITIGAASLLAVAGVMAYNSTLFGEASLAAGYMRRPDPSIPPSSLLEYGEAVLGTLVSPARGILVLSPFLIMLVPGLAHAWRVAPHWVKGAALSGAVYMLVHLVLNRFSGGENFFSYRIPIEMLTLSSPLLLLAWKEWTAHKMWRRRAFVLLAGLSVLVHAFGAVHWIPAFDEHSPWTNVHLLEAIRSAGFSGLWLVAVVAAVTSLFVAGVGHRFEATVR